MNTIDNTVFIGKVWMHFDNLASTNAYALHWLEQATLTEGVLITTFNQTAGRGQMGNQWYCEPDKNLAYTIVLKPQFLSIDEQFHLNKAIALAVRDFFVTLLEPSPPLSYAAVKVKWANDIYINDQKVGGILIQNQLAAQRLHSAVIGIGLNINQTIFPNLPQATGLKALTGIEYDLYECIQLLSQCIEKRYLQLKSRDFNRLHQAYLSHLYRYQETAVFQDAKTQSYFSGTIINVTDTGHLVVRSGKGQIQYNIKEIIFC